MKIWEIYDGRLGLWVKIVCANTADEATEVVVAEDADLNFCGDLDELDSWKQDRRKCYKARELVLPKAPSVLATYYS